MREMYITPGIDEAKVIADAIDKSRTGEAVQIHWHRRLHDDDTLVQCEAKYEHALYKDGYERSSAYSLERGSGRT
jgi:hypothetical protein